MEIVDENHAKVEFGFVMIVMRRRSPLTIPQSRDLFVS
jgi:hypothetical protein